MARRWTQEPPPEFPREVGGLLPFRQRWFSFMGALVENFRRLFVWSVDAEARIDALEAAPGGSGNSGTFEVDFGASLSFETTATVAATWVGAASEIVFAPNHTATTDHTVEETLVEGVTVAVTTLTAGVSFAVLAIAPNGTTGKHRFSYVGV